MDSSKKLQDIITCNICFEVYNVPQSLKCRHVYCHDCIQQLKEGSEIQCPDCRETCSIHEIKKDSRTQTLVHNLQKNTLKDVLDSSGSMRVCDICKESTKAAKCFCEICEQFLCRNCQKAHSGMKISKDHTLTDFVQVLNEKQNGIAMEVKKLQAKRMDVHESVSSVDNFRRKLQGSLEQLIGEVNKCRKDIKQRVDEHHDDLISDITSTIESVHEMLKETKSLFVEYDCQLEERTHFLTDVSGSEDFSLMTKTLADLNDQIEKDLHYIDKQLAQFDSQMRCPVKVLKGQEWESQKSTQIEVAHETVEHIREVSCQSKVLPRYKKIHKSYRQVKCIDLTFNPSKLCACNDELWVGGWDKGIYVFDLDLEQTNHIEHDQLEYVSSVIKTLTGMIVCDFKTGIHHLNHKGNYTNLICSGSFSDVCLTSNNKIYALDGRQGEIYTFVRNQNSWVKDIQFKLEQCRIGCEADTLCSTSSHLYVCSSNNHCVLVYTLHGEFVYKTGEQGDEVGKFTCPCLSDVDSGGKLLLCDYWNNRLQVFDTQNRQWSEIDGVKGVWWPGCAGVGDKYLWVGSGSDGTHLLKYEVVV